MRWSASQREIRRNRGTQKGERTAEGPAAPPEGRPTPAPRHHEGPGRAGGPGIRTGQAGGKGIVLARHTHQPFIIYWDRPIQISHCTRHAKRSHKPILKPNLYKSICRISTTPQPPDLTPNHTSHGWFPHLESRHPGAQPGGSKRDPGSPAQSHFERTGLARETLERERTLHPLLMAPSPTA